MKLRNINNNLGYPLQLLMAFSGLFVHCWPLLAFFAFVASVAFWAFAGLFGLC
jgi:hypothetical protein